MLVYLSKIRHMLVYLSKIRYMLVYLSKIRHMLVYLSKIRYMLVVLLNFTHACILLNLIHACFILVFSTHAYKRGHIFTLLNHGNEVIFSHCLTMATKSYFHIA